MSSLRPSRIDRAAVAAASRRSRRSRHERGQPQDRVHTEEQEDPAEQRVHAIARRSTDPGSASRRSGRHAGLDLREAFRGARVARLAGLEPLAWRNARCRVRRREDPVCAVTVGTLGHTSVAEVADLSMERVAVRAERGFMAGPALAHDRQLPAIAGGIGNVMCGVAIGADRRQGIPRLHGLRVHAGLIRRTDPLMARRARVDDLQACHLAVLVAVTSDVVGAMARHARRRHDQALGEQRAPVDAVAKFIRDSGCALADHWVHGSVRRWREYSTRMCGSRDPTKAGCRACRDSPRTPPPGRLPHARARARLRCVPRPASRGTWRSSPATAAQGVGSRSYARGPRDSRHMPSRGCRGLMP